jgi:SH3 domain protein
MAKQAFLCLALGAWVGAASADTVYVTDSLRLGLHAAPDTSDRPFENLVSGTPVEVLERNASYARVRLADGREGWVKATFLVADKPAAARVLELQAALGDVESVAAAAKTAQTAAEQQLANLRSELEATTGSSESIRETIERLERENAAHLERIEQHRHTLPLAWVVPAVVVSLVAGFLVGLWWLDALIRRRHGGFRVY